jgi:hypothetical protein
VGYASLQEDGQWKHEVVAPGTSGSLAAIAVGSDNQVHIVHVSSVKTELVYTYRNQLSTWNTSTLDDHHFGGDPSVAIDPDGGVHLTYTDWPEDNWKTPKLTYQWAYKNQWSQVELPTQYD